VSTRRCGACSVEKPATLEHFYAEARTRSGLTRRCRPCMAIRSVRNEPCAGCGEPRRVRADSPAARCRNCAQREAAGRPERRAKNATNARVQVLRQGGIPNARKFDGENHSGPRHHNWRGGITPEMQRLRGSAEARDWRRAVLARDSYKCRACGASGRLHADHIQPWSTHPDLRFDISNGRALCVPCHRLTPSYGANQMKAIRALQRTVNAHA
jgi:5-methylcytosine-specific restriction endonuclease McrA